MSLRDEIAKTIHDEYHWQVDGVISPECVDLAVHAAEAVLALLRKEADDTTWYCTRFGIAAYEPDICARYGHEGCGKRHIIGLGGEEQ